PPTLRPSHSSRVALKNRIQTATTRQRATKRRQHRPQATIRLLRAGRRRRHLVDHRLLRISLLLLLLGRRVVFLLLWWVVALLLLWWVALGGRGVGVVAGLRRVALRGVGLGWVLWWWGGL
ncbi:hypothetical protein P167DRAFT_328235, partial [Morchella conica CCBAS932]